MSEATADVEWVLRRSADRDKGCNDGLHSALECSFHLKAAKQKNSQGDGVLVIMVTQRLARHWACETSAWQRGHRQSADCAV